MNYSEEEKESIEQLRSWRDYIIKNKDKVNKANDIEFYLRLVLNLIQKQDKIIDYSIDRILPSPEEYLEIKNIMKQNKWGYDRSKKEYFKKECESDEI